ncbi:hypothetical protein JEZ13_03155 [bacterium]|nr:hypothetical protein [bacterium]
MNNIVERQNRYENIQKIAAFRQIYEDAKFWLKIQTILSVPIVIILSIIAIYINESFQNEVTIIFAITSFLITVLNVTFFPYIIKKLKTKAALVQEYFDCTVLTIEWNFVQHRNKPNSEDILKYSSKYIKKNITAKFENWYSYKVTNLPLPIARIVCQRTNCWWDIELREKLNNWIIGFNSVAFIFLIILSCFNNLNITTVITNVAIPLIPLIVFSCSCFSENKSTIDSLSQRKNYIEEVIDNVFKNEDSKDDLEIISRNIQDIIFSNRANNFIILTSIYKRFKKNMEEGMNFSVSEFIKKYEEKNNYC